MKACTKRRPGYPATAYGWVNVKLDKAGGFTQALEMVKAAKSRNLNVMIGCMVASSLSLAPAHLLAQLADLADLDGPLWLSEDRPDKLPLKALRLLRPRLPYGAEALGREARSYLYH